MKDNILKIQVFRKVGDDVRLLYGQSEEKHGEKYFHRRVLKEFNFEIHKTNWPEAMSLSIKEYQLIQLGQEDTLKRKLLCTSKYHFFYDEDEDFSCKLLLTIHDAGGQEICNIVYRQRDSENRPYWDTGYVLSADLRRFQYFFSVIIFPRSTTCLKKLIGTLKLMRMRSKTRPIKDRS